MGQRRPWRHGSEGLHAGGDHPGDDPVDAQRARLASLWALVLHRFRAYAQRGSAAAHRDSPDGDS